MSLSGRLRRKCIPTLVLLACFTVLIGIVLYSLERSKEKATMWAKYDMVTVGSTLREVEAILGTPSETFSFDGDTIPDTLAEQKPIPSIFIPLFASIWVRTTESLYGMILIQRGL